MAVHAVDDRGGRGSHDLRGITGHSLLTPRTSISRGLSIVLGVLGIAVVFGLWQLATTLNWISPLLLPSPEKVWNGLWHLFSDQNFIGDVVDSSRRVYVGFFLAALIAIPFGVAIGTWGVTKALFEPVFGAFRYMPVTAFVPLILVWVGIGEWAQVTVIFFGTFFPLVFLIADVAARVPISFVNVSYTLGARRRQAVWSVILRASWPDIVDSLRVTAGIAWTYLAAAELFAALTGIGHVIKISSTFFKIDQVLGSIVVIGALGILTDFAFRVFHRVLFPYVHQKASR
jgi:NitT/TauT family transport system permease protein